LGDALHQLISIHSLIMLALDVVKHNLLLVHLADSWIEARERNITLAFLMEGRKLPRNDMVNIVTCQT
jgi:hypothetical protein